MRAYVNWLPMNPSINTVGKLLVTQGLVRVLCNVLLPPFCCSRTLYFVAGGGGGGGIGGGSQRRMRISRRDDSDEDEAEDRDEGNDAPIYLADGNNVDLATTYDVRAVNPARLEEELARRSLMYVDKHVFMHRLYIGLDQCFGTR